MKQKLPDFSYEKKLWKQGYLVLGIDEVGRGCLSGPVHIGIVCFDPDKTETLKKVTQLGINDSKKLSANKRRELSSLIHSSCFFSQIKSSTVGFINKRGIVAAVERAVREGVHEIITKFPDRKIYLLLDAFNIKYIRAIGLKKQLAIVRGDSKSISIAAASIIAKVERDAQMSDLDKKFPQYGWARNKGYGTKEHISALRKHGHSRLHRALFIRNISPAKTFL